jgi:hypothetical protein
MAPEIETLAPVAGVTPVAPVAAGPLKLRAFRPWSSRVDVYTTRGIWHN